MLCHEWKGGGGGEKKGNGNGNESKSTCGSKQVVAGKRAATRQRWWQRHGDEGGRARFAAK